MTRLFFIIFRRCHRSSLHGERPCARRNSCLWRPGSPDLFRCLFVICPDAAEILVRQVFVDAEIIRPGFRIQPGPLGINGLEQGRHVFIGRAFGQVVFVDDLARMAGQRVRRYTALAVSAGLAAWTCAAGSAGTVLAASSAASPDKVVQVQNKAARIACFQMFTITPPSSFTIARRRGNRQYTVKIAREMDRPVLFYKRMAGLLKNTYQRHIINSIYNLYIKMPYFVTIIRIYLMK